MTEVRSEPFHPTTIERFVALGDEVIVYPGVHLADDIAVYPRLKLPFGHPRSPPAPRSPAPPTCCATCSLRPMRIGLALPALRLLVPGRSRRSRSRRWPSWRRPRRARSGSTPCGSPITSSRRSSATAADDARYGSLEPLTTLAALAPLTERVRLGTLVLSAGFRHPAIVAKSATDDRPPVGRAPRARDRGGMVRRRVRGVRLRVRPPVGERFGAARGDARRTSARCSTASRRRSRGERFALREAYNHPRPVQEPRPPISSGARAARGCSRLAARLADGWNTAWRWTPRGLRASGRAAAREACEAAGRDPADASGSRSACSRSWGRTRRTSSGGHALMRPRAARRASARRSASTALRAGRASPARPAQVARTARRVRRARRAPS